MANDSCPRASDAPTGGYFAHRRRGETPCELCTRRFVEHNAAYRKGAGRNLRHYEVTCEVCGTTTKVTKKDARFCSHECYIGKRRAEPSTALVLWRPPAVKTPSQRWKFAHRRWGQFKTKHPGFNGSMFVHGPCAWCSVPFTAVAGDWERRSLYCSKRCSSAAGKYRRGRFLVPPRVRQVIYERDGWTCQLCSDPVDPALGPSDPWAATLDHIVPRSHTLIPDDRPENLQLAHRWCNSVKGDERYYTAADLAA